MNLEHEFYRLPLRFDSDRLQQEIDQFADSDWCPHPQGFEGNSALLLISSRGSLDDDGLKGPQAITAHLQRCPYLQQVLASFATVLGRTRLMRLAPHAEAKAHMDASYYWHQRERIHVPIRTDPSIRFHCADQEVHMAAGECWVFNTWKMHNVQNPSDQTRIHPTGHVTLGAGELARADPGRDQATRGLAARVSCSDRSNPDPVLPMRRN